MTPEEKLMVIKDAFEKKFVYLSNATRGFACEGSYVSHERNWTEEWMDWIVKLIEDDPETIAEESTHYLIDDDVLKVARENAYGVKGKAETTDGNGKEIKDEGVLNSVFINEHGAAYICIEGMEYELDDVKPYLRPMTSMTEEEKEELWKAIDKDMDILMANLEAPIIHIHKGRVYRGELVHYERDFLISYHFDYNGLISIGLALEAPKEMYKNK